MEARSGVAGEDPVSYTHLSDVSIQSWTRNMETSVGTTKQSGKQMISIPGYEFSTVLHEGISTIIVQGHRIVDDLPVVAKLLRSEYPRPRDLARLRHEFGILRQLNVPNVIKAYSIEKYGNGIVLILEGLTAKALSEHIHRKTLDLGTSPVSYTHLDVYKRQVWRRLSKPS